MMKITYLKIATVSIIFLVIALGSCKNGEENVSFTPAPASISFVSSSMEVTEDNTTIFVPLNAMIASSASVNYSLTTENLTEGVDFINDSGGSVDIANNEVEAGIEITLLDNNADNSGITRTITLELTAATGAQVGLNGGGKVIVIEVVDEDKTIRISSPGIFDITEVPPLGDTLEIFLEMNEAPEADVAVTYNIGEIGGFSTPNDYKLISDNPLIIPAGENTGTIKILIEDDVLLPELGEGFSLTLNSVNTLDNEVSLSAEPNEKTVTYNVLDDIKTGEITDVLDLEIAENEETVSISVEFDNPSPEAILVSYNLTGTALPGIDYTDPNVGTLFFEAGVTEIPINLTILKDGFPDGDKELTVTLTGLNTFDNEAGLGPNIVKTITITDVD